ncbi:hypothetical protein [Carboxydothermus pertinax]|nr:hypothetical protein [Carboxydothermus pertinax]
MQLEKILSIGGKRRIIGYLMVLAFNIQIAILAAKQMESINNLHINDIYILFSRLIYFALYYIPIFLTIISVEDILNDYLILTRLKDLNIWWKKKFKLLSLDTGLYVIFLELPIIVTAIIYIGVPQILEAKTLVFMAAADFIIKYLIFLIIGIIYNISSFVSKRQYIGFVAGFFAGGFDYILQLCNLDRYAMTITGMLLKFFISSDLPTGKFLSLAIVYCFYLVFLSLFLFLVSREILRKIDVGRGDFKLKR